MFNFQGKAVLVTGASRGIGQATAIAFAQAGACVALHYSQDRAAAVAVQKSLTGTGHCVVQANIADAIAVERMAGEAIAHLGKIDILVNNAGIYQEHPLDKTSYSDWQQIWKQTLNVNLLGAVNVSYCVAKFMMEQKMGRIINITSRGAFRGEPNSPAYGASKAALNAFSQSLAQHLAPYHIAVTAVAPGWVDTDMARSILESSAGDAIRQQSPLHRVARPEEIAHTILFLATAESEFLTGGIVDVNGASYLR
ncbi:MAG: SDR family oxidoreductase [Leptolyngbyaceae cyanobacterium CSU_1_4]|nr:SDR family oxidoreductase [Leptolyngbyaceae cyanobacterium CSU_1_4]